MKITHVRLLVADFPACFRFYRDVMAFNVHWGNIDGDYASFLVGQGESFMLAIFDREAMAEVAGTTHLTTAYADGQDTSMLIVRAEDVDAAVRELHERGANEIIAPQDHPEWGIRSAYLRDPDGYLIELYSDMPRSEWSPELLEADASQ
jgi:catechol 2,3-dioxygenase-like lactoylglutathione lyase family enzyme